MSEGELPIAPRNPENVITAQAKSEKGDNQERDAFGSQNATCEPRTLCRFGAGTRCHRLGDGRRYVEIHLSQRLARASARGDRPKDILATPSGCT